jgi:hypothetical protein
MDRHRDEGVDLPLEPARPHRLLEQRRQRQRRRHRAAVLELVDEVARRRLELARHDVAVQRAGGDPRRPLRIATRQRGVAAPAERGGAPRPVAAAAHETLEGIEQVERAAEQLAQRGHLRRRGRPKAPHRHGGRRRADAMTAGRPVASCAPRGSPGSTPSALRTFAT